MMDQLQHLIADTTFWVAVSTVICFAYIIVKAYKPLLDSLDQRTNAIRVRMEEAENLYREAERVLNEYKAKQAQIEQEATNLLQAAEQRAQALMEQAQADIQKAIQRQENSAQMRIKRTENDVVNAIRDTLVKAALNRVQAELHENGSNDAIEASLTAVSKTLH
jgi:F-type H+-transporting ATPase subunit b